MFEQVRNLLADALDLDRALVTKDTDLREEYFLSSLEYLGALLSLDNLIGEDNDLPDTGTLLSLRTVGQIAEYIEHIV